MSALLFGVGGCKNYGSPDTTNANSSQQAPPGQNDANDPANANLAPVSNSTDNTGEPAGAEAEVPQEASQYKTYSNYQDPYANQPSSFSDYEDYSEYETPVVYAPSAPPSIPQYNQPACPGDGYIWTPGYWGYGGQGYYWVPGAWVRAPYAGALWTPGWWGYGSGRYGWHRGYWGRHIGYYGGINYGNGYDGFGYQGGYWRGEHFEYNRYENNINTSNVHSTYNYKVRQYNTSRVSYNGGQGGIQSRPRPEEVEALHEEHNPPMTSQMQMAQQARSDRQSFASENRGRPQLVAENHPLEADQNVPAPQPVRHTPPAPRTGTYPWQSGARPPQEVAYGAEPGPAESRMNEQQPSPGPRGPEARGGPVRSPGNPQAQPRQGESQRPEQTQEPHQPK